jgi:hypothetical protein
VNSYTGIYFRTAFSFDPYISGNLSCMDMGVTLASLGNGNFTLSLDANDTGGGPLTSLTLALGQLTSTIPFGGTNSALTTFRAFSCQFIDLYKHLNFLIKIAVSRSATD